METTLIPERLRQIAAANFDRYVFKRLVEQEYVVHDDGIIDERELNSLAALAGCNSDKLHSTIVISRGRITKTDVRPKISHEEEYYIMIAIAKLHIKQTTASMINYNREFGKIVSELNHHHSELRVTLKELTEFIKPIYFEAVSEVFAV